MDAQGACGYGTHTQYGNEPRRAAGVVPARLKNERRWLRIK